MNKYLSEYSMRRADRQIQDREGILAVIDAADVCRIGLYADGELYIVPMNFGFELENDGKLSLYFHCAKAGRKLDMIAKNPEVCFELDTDHALTATGDGTACSYSMDYASLIGNGRIEILTDADERTLGMKTIMRKYAPGKDLPIPEKVFALTTILKLTAHSYSGKRRGAAAANHDRSSFS